MEKILVLNEKEKHAIKCFKRYHTCEYYHLKLGHIDVDVANKIKDMVFQVDVEQTGIGGVVTVMCTACNEMFDVTDYDAW